MEIKDIIKELYKLDDKISKCESKKEALDCIEELIVEYSNKAAKMRKKT